MGHLWGFVGSFPGRVGCCQLLSGSTPAPSDPSSQLCVHNPNTESVLHILGYVLTYAPLFMVHTEARVSSQSLLHLNTCPCPSQASARLRQPQPLDGPPCLRLRPPALGHSFLVLSISEQGASPSLSYKDSAYPGTFPGAERPCKCSKLITQPCRHPLLEWEVGPQDCPPARLNWKCLT